MIPPFGTSHSDKGSSNSSSTADPLPSDKATSLPTATEVASLALKSASSLALSGANLTIEAAYISADVAQLGYQSLSRRIIGNPGNLSSPKKLGHWIEYAYYAQSTGILGRFIQGGPSKTKGVCYIPLGRGIGGSIEVREISFNLRDDREQVMDVEMSNSLFSEILTSVQGGRLGTNQAKQILNDLQTIIPSESGISKSLCPKNSEFMPLVISQMDNFRQIDDIPLEFNIETQSDDPIPPSSSSSTSSSSADAAQSLPITHQQSTSQLVLDSLFNRVVLSSKVTTGSDISIHLGCTGIQSPCTIVPPNSTQCPLSYAYDISSSGWMGWLQGTVSKTTGIVCIPLGINVKGQPILLPMAFSFQGRSYGISPDDAKNLALKLKEQLMNGNLSAKEASRVIRTLFFHNLNDSISKELKPRTFLQRGLVKDLDPSHGAIYELFETLNTMEFPSALLTENHYSKNHTFLIQSGLDASFLKSETVILPLTDGKVLERESFDLIVQMVRSQMQERRSTKDAALNLLNKLKNEHTSIFLPEMMREIEALIAEFSALETTPERRWLNNLKISLENR